MRRQSAYAQQSLATVLCLALALAPALSACTSVADQGAAKVAQKQEADDEADPDETAADNDAVTEEIVTDAAADEPLEKPKKPSGKDTAKKAKPKYNTKLQKRLKPLLAEIAEASGMQVGIAVIDLADKTPISYQGDLKLPSASMIKLLVASALLQRVDAGALALDETHVLAGEEIVGGAGSLAGLGAGASVSIERMLSAMIEESDNTATNALINILGMDEINAEATRLGLSQTVLGRKMMDAQAAAEGRDNYTCADDLATILAATYDGTLAKPELCQTLVADLERQQDWGGIRNGLPEGVTFAHKTGSLDYVRHDGGIVEGEHPYVLVVLCGGEGYYEGGALETMAQAARVTHEAIAAPSATE